MENGEKPNRPKCPHCSASPIPVSADVVYTPDKSAAIPMVWCDNCKNLLGIMVAPTSPAAQPHDETGLGPQPATGIHLA
jgi:hypothetical protein